VHLRGPDVLSSDDPVTIWIDELRQADQTAARKLWHHFVARLYELGRKKLRPETRRVYDEEDAAQSAFHSVCAGVAAGRFPDLGSRENLWHLLVVITARKVAHRHRHDRQQSRDVNRNLSDSIFVRPGDDSPSTDVDLTVSREPTPEFAAEFVETCECLFESLDDPALREVVTLRLEGYTDAEVADRLRCSRRTIQRRLEVVRRRWGRLELSSG
jgi:RNA polymerase sigma factor (sigma-70 family)